MRILIIVTVVVVAVCVGLAGCRRKPSTSAQSPLQFVSMTCEKGDITLSLQSGQVFTLVLKHWDAQTNQHTHEDRTSGSWEKKDNQLILTSPESVLIYKPETNTFTIGGSSVSVDGYGWVSGTKGTPFDTYSLVEKEKTDAFLVKASKETE